MSSPTGVLIIDDDANILGCLSTALAGTCRVHLASSGEEGLSQFDRLQPDVVLLDVMLPEMSGLAVLRALKKKRHEQPVIMMTGFAEVQTAVQAIKLGALDYLQKPVDPSAVLRQIAEAVARAKRVPNPARAKVVGESRAMKAVWRLVESFGPTDIPILLQGETGTGKGLIAEALHGASRRASAPLVSLDCATIPEQLAESELFGYEDGAFTGAGKRRRGRVAFADGGTLFLDEIGTLSMVTQAKLLTVIESQSFVPLGARQLQPTHIDVRIIGATNVPLHRAVASGSFRADLFHRLNGMTIDLPPLRSREGDLELLAEYFLKNLRQRHGKPDLGISSDALDVMREYAWPGNVRELQRVLSAAVVLAHGTITADDLPSHVREGADATGVQTERVEVHPPGVAATAADRGINLRDIKEWAGREAQKRVILELQGRTNISRQELARMLGVDPKTLRSRLKEIRVERPKSA